MVRIIALFLQWKSNDKNNFFSVDQGINRKKNRELFQLLLRALMQSTFFVLVDTSINRKKHYIHFLSAFEIHASGT